MHAVCFLNCTVPCAHCLLKQMSSKRETQRDSPFQLKVISTRTSLPTRAPQRPKRTTLQIHIFTTLRVSRTTLPMPSYLQHRQALPSIMPSCQNTPHQRQYPLSRSHSSNNNSSSQHRHRCHNPYHSDPRTFLFCQNQYRRLHKYKHNLWGSRQARSHHSHRTFHNSRDESPNSTCLHNPHHQ